MHLWILSDLHIGSCRSELPDPGPGSDVLIAAGDIFTPASSAAAPKTSMCATSLRQDLMRRWNVHS
jgi:hypothetical protein